MPLIKQLSPALTKIGVKMSSCNRMLTRREIASNTGTNFAVMGMKNWYIIHLENLSLKAI